MQCIVGKKSKSKSRKWIVPLTIFLDYIDGEDKIQEIFDSVDENHDEVADPWEMHDWMLSVESHVQKFDLDEQWYTLGQTDMDNMTWPDFVFKVSSLKVN